MATTVTITPEYRIDDYFDQRQSGGDIFIYTSGGGSYFDPSIYYSAAVLNGGQLDNRYYTETELNGGQLDTRYFTETESDARFVRLTTNQTIAGIKTFSSAANFSAGINVTGAITGDNEVESYDTSDIRLKERIQDLSRKETVAAVMSLRAIRYYHKLKKKTEIGLIAQEVSKYFPEVVKPNTEGYLMINYSKLVAPLLVTIQDLQSQIDELKEIVKRGTRGK